MRVTPPHMRRYSMIDPWFQRRTKLWRGGIERYMPPQIRIIAFGSKEPEAVEWGIPHRGYPVLINLITLKEGKLMPRILIINVSMKE